jgi:ABC-type glutathione transport system ATPase component
LPYQHPTSQLFCNLHPDMKTQNNSSESNISVRSHHPKNYATTAAALSATAIDHFSKRGRQVADRLYSCRALVENISERTSDGGPRTVFVGVGGVGKTTILRLGVESCSSRTSSARRIHGSST